MQKALKMGAHLGVPSKSYLTNTNMGNTEYLTLMLVVQNNAKSPENWCSSGSTQQELLVNRAKESMVGNTESNA